MASGAASADYHDNTKLQVFGGAGSGPGRVESATTCNCAMGGRNKFATKAPAGIIEHRTASRICTSRSRRWLHTWLSNRTRCDPLSPSSPHKSIAAACTGARPYVENRRYRTTPRISPSCSKTSVSQAESSTPSPILLPTRPSPSQNPRKRCLAPRRIGRGLPRRTGARADRMHMA